VVTDLWHDERTRLQRQIVYETATLADDERALTRLIEITPWFFSSDRCLSIERIVKARRIRERMEAELAGRIDRAKLVELVQAVMNGTPSEEEGHAYLSLVQRYVPHPAVSDLIYWPKNGEPTAEQVVDVALAWRPDAN
jgi:hypothetical protein